MADSQFDMTSTYLVITIIILAVAGLIMWFVYSSKKDSLSGKTAEMFGTRKYFMLQNEHGCQRIEGWSFVPPDKVMFELSDGSRPVYNWNALEVNVQNAITDTNIVIKLKKEKNERRRTQEVERSIGEHVTLEELQTRASDRVHASAERTISHAKELVRGATPRGEQQSRAQ